MGLLYLAITDGTTTCTLADGAGGGTSYRLTYGAWAPKLALRRAGQLSGRSPYEDVAEEMTISIHGSSLADAYTKLQTLMTLLEQAGRFERGESVSPVVLKYSPPGATVSSAASPLQAVIISGEMVTPGNFNAGQPQFVISHLKIRVRRQGEWKHVTEAASSAATNSGDLATITLPGAAKALAPTALQMTNCQMRSLATDQMIVLAAGSNRVQVLAANGGAGGAFAAVNDAARFARNTTVLRYTPAGTAEVTATIGAVSLDAATRTCVVLASVRNNSATTAFAIRARLDSTGGVAYTPTQRIEANALNPQWVVLGLVALSETPQFCNLAVTASAASGTLDVDSIVIVAVNFPEVHIVGVQDNPSFSGRATLVIDHRALTRESPVVTMSGYAGPYTGNVWLPTQAAAVTALVLQCGSLANADRWRTTFTSGAEAVETNVFTATRLRAMIAPE